MTKSKHEQTLDAAKAVVKAIETLESDQQRQTLQMAAQVLGLEAAPARAPTGGAQPATVMNADSREQVSQLSAKDFLRLKKPNSDIERVACLAYYLTYAKNTPHFKAKHIDDLNTQAAQPAMNVTRGVDNATRRSKLLAIAKGGNKQISPLGEEVVEALPDQAKVKALLLQQGVHTRAGKRKKRKKGSAAK